MVENNGKTPSKLPNKLLFFLFPTFPDFAILNAVAGEYFPRLQHFLQIINSKNQGG